MADLKLTDSQLKAIAYYVRSQIAAETRTVWEYNMVDSLEGVESMPVIQNIGGVRKTVRAPITLLSEPAWQAVKDLVEDLEKAFLKVDSAADKAINAANTVDAATEESKKQTAIMVEKIKLAVEVLSHPPIVEDNILYVYDIDTHEYYNTGQCMKGVTFKPFYDPADGMLYWTNDGGLENPEPVRVEGNVMFATFAFRDDGHLIMRTVPEYKGADFKMVDGRLKAVI
ncbi:MAG: hypothetical protein LIP05_08440 [Tannerellaceae bacterium]|nr:hypothetical protein [Tannerellaceae bacterium]